MINSFTHVVPPCSLLTAPYPMYRFHARQTLFQSRAQTHVHHPRCKISRKILRSALCKFPQSHPYDAKHQQRHHWCGESDPYEDAWDEYDDASDLYYEKELRDELRESLQDSTIDVEVYSLYYYDGKESVALSKNLTSNSYYLSYAQDSPVIMYKEYNQDTSAGVKLSEIESTYEVENLVRENLESTAISYVAIGEQTSMLEQKNATQIQFSSDGKELFYVEDLADDEESGDLYKANISEKGVQKPEFVDEDVYPYLLRQVDNHLIYFKNYDSNNNRGDLWVDGKEVDSDVCGYKLYFNEGAIFYYSDWNEDKRNGTLKLYKKDKTTKIADDVYSCMLKEDSILYLHDFSWNSYTGSLFRYENGNSEKISDDVNCIIF